jgi:hypothetical protein
MGTCVHTVINGGGGGEGIGGLGQINTCRQVTLLVNFLENPTYRVWCLYRYLVRVPTYLGDGRDVWATERMGESRAPRLFLRRLNKQLLNNKSI